MWSIHSCWVGLLCCQVLPPSAGRFQWPRGQRHCSLKRWDHGLEFRSWRRYLSEFIRVCVYLCRYRPCDSADPPSKEGYRLSVLFLGSELILNRKRLENLIRQATRRWSNVAHVRRAPKSLLPAWGLYIYVYIYVFLLQYWLLWLDFEYVESPIFL
jgi:hypothetical protein